MPATKDELGLATRQISRSGEEDSLAETLVVPGAEPAQFGNYEIICALGQGGMGEVLLARIRGGTADGIEAFVALKRLLPHAVADPDHVNMFIDEARICARLSHENLAQVIEFGKEGEAYFLAMEYVHGVSVKRILAELDNLPPAEVTAYVVSCVCAGLHHAHTRKDDHGLPLRVIHRDVNPNNVLIGADGQVKVIDFGVARAAERLHQTVGATIKGSFAYMSPEQASADPLDHRSDVFSTGTLLYVMLTGTNPFVGNNVMHTLELVREARAPAPHTVDASVSRELEAICQRAMARDPDDRFPSAAAMQQVLERYCHAHDFGARAMRLWIRTAFPDLTERLELGALRAAATRSTGRDVDEDAPAVTVRGRLRGPGHETVDDDPPTTPEIVAASARLPDSEEVTGETEEILSQEMIDPIDLQGDSTREIPRGPRPVRGLPVTPSEPDPELAPTPPLADGFATETHPAAALDAAPRPRPGEGRSMRGAVLAAGLLGVLLAAGWLFWRTATSSAIITPDASPVSIFAAPTNSRPLPEATMEHPATHRAPHTIPLADQQAIAVDAAPPEVDAAPPEVDAAPPEVDAAPPRRVVRQRVRKIGARPRRRRPPPANQKRRGRDRPVTRQLGDEGAVW